MIGGRSVDIREIRGFRFMLLERNGLGWDAARAGLLVFANPWTGDGHLLFVCERAGPGPEPEPGVIVPVRKVYIVLNNITLHRVDTGA